eukprot:CAMPEP_0118955512 /NCGR_PEP_ID=MMETSP1169-20130426/60090_1 /TAXON_ID=36882 /ORGANISM="Pyramimonas obovata, Strain CCMP722" /LENGTH=535 /DNA_ID=CAMNT_0006903381 /DNA_START=178 /DNA_END=1782 /DNA_ORIENTATION=+
MPAVSKLEISLECNGLKNKDILSKSDPVVYLYERRAGHRGESSWTRLGSTEVVKNNLNPKFSTAIQVDYFFEERQELLFKVLDVDGPIQRDGEYKGDFLGTYNCFVSDIVLAKGRTVTGQLQKDGKPYKGTIKITFEEVAELRQDYVFHWRGVKLANRDGWFSKSDPFITLSKKAENGQWVQVHKTEVIRNNLNPVWKPFKISSSRLCQGDVYRPIRLECNDWDSDDKYDEIGYIETNVSELCNPNQVIRLKHPKGKNKSVGTIEHISPPQVVDKPSFTAYLQGGLEISVAVAIDFTASNGDPSHPQSLHHRPPIPNYLNSYEQAIWSVGNILAPYDADQQFAVFGYGAALPPSKVTSHCFNLSGNPVSPMVSGVEGILDAYRQALQSVQLSGPTLFQNVIDNAARLTQAEMKDGRQKYTILMIITDGEIMDMDQTIHAIVKASTLPMAIVIVGVGDTDFASMERLDDDEELLRSPLDGRSAAFDIVQFVEFRKYAGPAAGPRLAREVLMEVPEQVVQYFMSKGIAPNPPRPPGR